MRVPVLVGLGFAAGCTFSWAVVVVALTVLGWQ